MPQDRNPFRSKAADSRLLETSQFITLVIPTFLDEIDFRELFLPQLSIIRGTPGIGKSTLLRLFDIETLIELKKRGDQDSHNPVFETLSSKGVFEGGTVRRFGLYLHCDSSFKDLGAVRDGKAVDLTKTLLDIKICIRFFESLKSMSNAGLLELPEHWNLPALPVDTSPPRLFASKRDIDEFIQVCRNLEGSFADLLNSFPDDIMPDSLQPHARMYSLLYLQEILSSNPNLQGLMPIIMMDDFQDLNANQRDMIKNELLRRVPIPRWVAVRNHIYELEELIKLEGAGDKREYHILPIDDVYKTSPKKFIKLTSEITRQRLLITPALMSMTVDAFRGHLPGSEETIESERALAAVNKLMSSYKESLFNIPLKLRRLSDGIRDGVVVTFGELLDWEVNLIIVFRLAKRNQLKLFDEEIPVESVVDSKVLETARLSLSKKLGLPYFVGFDTIANAASTNIKQFLDISAEFVEWMIGRTELSRDVTLSAVEQEKRLGEIAEGYFDRLDIQFGFGSYIKRLVRNLGRLFLEITFLPNAPYAPGVTGFSLPLDELRSLAKDSSSDERIILKDVLRSAVAWNVLQVRSTRQGTKNSEEKQIFYFNRLLCVYFGLPLNYGSWRPLNQDSIIMMMKREIEGSEIRSLVKREEPEREIVEPEIER